MSAFEMWTCDWHAANGPESDADVVNEDQARDDGWVVIEARFTGEVVFPAVGTLPELRLPPRLQHTIKHVCPSCLADPECREWIEREGFKGYFTEDKERLQAAAT